MSKKRTLQNIALFVVSVAAGILMIELMLFIYNPIVSTVRSDKIVLQTNATYRYVNPNLRGVAENITASVNAIGFRGENPHERLDGFLSLIAVGGSTTRCAYQSDGKDWPSLLGRILGNHFDRVWMNNAGLDGHSTFGHRVLLTDYISNIRPKVLILLVGTNDVGLAAPTDHDIEGVADGIHLANFEQFVKSLSNYSGIAAAALNVYRSYKAKTLGLGHTALDLSSLPRATIDEEALQTILRIHRTEYVPRFEKRLTDLVRSIRAAEITPVLMTQPLLVGRGIDDVTGIDLEAVEVHLYAEEISGKAAWEILELYNDVTRNVARSEGAHLVDLARLFPKSSRLFYDLIHYTDEGAEAVAVLTYRQLCPILTELFPQYLSVPCGEDSASRGNPTSS